MQRSEQVNELAAALATAQGQIQDAKRDSSNPYFKSKYADLASVWEACRKPLSTNGLSVVQTIEIKEGKRLLESTLLHSSGQWLTSSLDLVPKEETEQAIGSAITYSRRYALAALVGICPDDDDGEAAMARGRPAAEPQKTAGKAPLPTQQAGSTTKPPASDAPAQKTTIVGKTDYRDLVDDWPLGMDGAKIKDGTDLAIFAGKHGIGIADFRRILAVGKPQDVVKVREAAHELFPQGVHEAKQEAKS